MKKVHVAVGVIRRQQQTFVTLRHADQHQGGKWEFPGGKVEDGETVTAALRRELAEEVGIQVQRSTPLIDIHHDYGDKQVHLDVHLVDDFDGEPFGREQQSGRWVAINALNPADFPAANAVIIERLQQ